MPTRIVCVICQNTKTIIKIIKAKRNHPTLYFCRKCGFVFAHPQKAAEIYDSIFKPITNEEYDSRKKNFELRYLKFNRLLNSKSNIIKVLDIGSGDGIFLDLMKKNGFDVLGVEPSYEYAKYSESKFGLKIINDNFENLVTKTVFNLITMFNVLEHSINLKYFLSKVNSLLSLKGLIVLEVPYIFTPQSALSFGYWHHFEIDHNWFFNRSNITLLLADFGFHVISIQFIPKIVRLSKILDGILTRTIYMHISLDTYLKFRESTFYKLLNSYEAKININDYLFIIAKKIDNITIPIST